MSQEVNTVAVDQRPFSERVLARLDELEAKIDAVLDREKIRSDGIWLSVEEAAKKMGLSRRHVERGIERGLLAATNVAAGRNHRWRIHPDDLKRWAQATAM